MRTLKLFLQKVSAFCFWVRVPGVSRDAAVPEDRAEAFSKVFLANLLAVLDHGQRRPRDEPVSIQGSVFTVQVFLVRQVKYGRGW